MNLHKFLIFQKHQHNRFPYGSMDTIRNSEWLTHSHTAQESCRRESKFGRAGQAKPGGLSAGVTGTKDKPIAKLWDGSQ
jgi:hypothetical protein